MFLAIHARTVSVVLPFFLLSPYPFLSARLPASLRGGSLPLPPMHVSGVEPRLLAGWRLMWIHLL